MQLLDVSFDRALKKHWRGILKLWKITEGQKLTTLPKTEFPKLLKKLQKLMVNATANVYYGF